MPLRSPLRTPGHVLDQRRAAAEQQVAAGEDAAFGAAVQMVRQQVERGPPVGAHHLLVTGMNLVAPVLVPELAAKNGILPGQLKSTSLGKAGCQ